MAIQFLTYDDSNMESGKFYLIEANTNQANNVRPTTSITTPLNQATQDIINLKAKNDLQDIDINLLKESRENYLDLILDNQARINNLEDTEIEKIIVFLDKTSIKKQFINVTKVEVLHNRKEICSIKVMQILENTPTKFIAKNITIGTLITEEINKDTQGNIINKKVICDFGNTPITGYVIII